MATIPWTISLNGVRKTIRNRSFCLKCSPWGNNNRKDLTVSDDQRLEIRKIQNRKKSLAYYKRNPGKQQTARRERKFAVVKIFGGKCQICGYNKCIECLQFHHRDPKTKLFSLSGIGWLSSMDRLISEAKKCDLLCSNCHCELHRKGGANGGSSVV